MPLAKSLPAVGKPQTRYGRCRMPRTDLWNARTADGKAIYTLPETETAPEDVEYASASPDFPSLFAPETPVEMPKIAGTLLYRAVDGGYAAFWNALGEEVAACREGRSIQIHPERITAGAYSRILLYDPQAPLSIWDINIKNPFNPRVPSMFGALGINNGTGCNCYMVIMSGIDVLIRNNNTIGNPPSNLNRPLDINAIINTVNVASPPNLQGALPVTNTGGGIENFTNWLIGILLANSNAVNQATPFIIKIETDGHDIFTRLSRVASYFTPQTTNTNVVQPSGHWGCFQTDVNVGYRGTYCVANDNFEDIWFRSRTTGASIGLIITPPPPPRGSSVEADKSIPGAYPIYPNTVTTLPTAFAQDTVANICVTRSVNRRMNNPTINTISTGGFWIIDTAGTLNGDFFPADYGSGVFFTAINQKQALMPVGQQAILFGIVADCFTNPVTNRTHNIYAITSLLTNQTIGTFLFAINQVTMGKVIQWFHDSWRTKPYDKIYCSTIV